MSSYAASFMIPSVSTLHEHQISEYQINDGFQGLPRLSMLPTVVFQRALNISRIRLGVLPVQRLNERRKFAASLNLK